MICSKCGKELPKGAIFCGACGNYCTPCRLIDAMQDVFSSKLTLLAALLMSATVISELVLGVLLIFEIPIAVGLWMAYIAGNKKKPLQYKHSLKIFSAVALIDTLLMWITAGAFMVMGVLLMVFGEACVDEITVVIPYMHSLEMVVLMFDPFSPLYNPEYYPIVLGVVMLIIGALQAVITRFVYTKMHHCAASTLCSFQYGEDRIKHLRLTRITMSVLAILSAFSVLQKLIMHHAIDFGGLLAVLAEFAVVVLIVRFEKRLKTRGE